MNLYRLASRVQDAKALASGDPARIAHRVRNKLIARAIFRTGLWKALWR